MIQKQFTSTGRIFGLILFALLFVSWESASQDRQQIEIDFKDAQLKTVLAEVTKQTGYSFVYSENVISPEMAVTVSYKGNVEPVGALLDRIFKETDVMYKVKGKQVALSLKPAAVETVVTAQAKTGSFEVGGSILDENDVPCVGVYITIAGTQTGTTSDLDGKYNIKVKEGDRLVYSCVGFRSQEYRISSRRSVINIRLENDKEMLENAVVIGYGNTQKIKDLTGSISHVGEKQIKEASIGTNVQSMLQGRAAGVNVQIQSASPTSPVSVIIRGQSSLSGDNQPLWVIDGIPEYNAGVSGSISNVLYSLNLNDVESVDILKDASSTAIYGSRAANGVIVVTTRSGKEGMKPTMEFSSKLGYQMMDFNGYDYFTAKEYIAFTRAATRKELNNRGKMDYFTRQYLDEKAFFALNTSEMDTDLVLDKEGAYYDSDTYWMGEMTQNPLQQQYDLSIRGGTPQVNYLAGLSYNDVQGVVKSGYNKIFSGRIRLEARIRKNLKFRINATGSTRSTSNKDGMLSILKKIRPDIPVYNEDGTLFTKDAYTENPFTTLKNTNSGTGENISGLAELEWTILDGLILSSKGSINYSNTSSLRYDRKGSTFNTTGSRSWGGNKSDTKIWDNSLVYANVIGKHDISASLTASMEKFQSIYYGMYASNFPDDDVLNSFSDAASMGSMSESTSANTMVSQIGRIQYKYDEKYLATMTLRHDGSSRFGPGRKWGWFPSAGVGWTVSEEPWLKESKVGEFVSFLKLRASYGKSGSQNLSDYQWMTMVGSGQYNETPGIYPSNIGNNNLQWEESYMTDLAVEWEVLNSRIRGSLGYYSKDSRNLIYDITLPLSSAFSSVSANIASTLSKGVEFSLDVDVIKNNKWQLTLNANGASDKTFVTKFNNTEETYQPRYGYTRIKVGEEIGRWYGFKSYKRLFGSAEEVAALKPRGEKGTVDSYRNSYETDGDVYMMDLDGDGKITDEDKTDLGSYMPKLFGGFGFQLYAGTSFNIGTTFTYSVGAKRYWAMPASDVNYTGNYNQSNKIAGQSAVLQSPYLASTMPNATPYGHGDNGVFSDYWLYDASYIRLSTLNISYRFGKEYFGDSIIDNIDLTLQAGNLFTLTKYPGFDPQGNFSSSTSLLSNTGVDYSYYPSSRNFTLGVKITFK